jgi:hypothetical protein
MPDDRISKTLALMALPKDARLTDEVAREVCQRSGNAATIEGAISGLSNQYVLDLRAIDCRNGDVLAKEEVKAEGKAQVIKALGGAATAMRKKLGESLVSIQRFDAPAEDVTTGSLEATFSLPWCQFLHLDLRHGPFDRRDLTYNSACRRKLPMNAAGDLEFAHRLNAGSTFDSMCMSCFLTIGTAENEPALAGHEKMHR